MNLVHPGSRCLFTLARGCASLAVVTLLSCETPSHLREDFGASYREAIRVQTDRDHVRRSFAGSTLDGRAAVSLYEDFVKHYGAMGDRAQQSDMTSPHPGAELFSGSGSSQTGSLPTGEPK